ncbi:MAG: substrate-binding periplasmic protein [Desulfamplus sp.]
MKSRFFILIFLFEFLFCNMAGSDTIYEDVSMVFSDSGYPPFHINSKHKKTEAETGIVVDLLNKFQENYPYKIYTHVMPIRRVNFELDRGSMDMRYDSPVFVGKKADNFIWSEPFANSRDCIIALKNSWFEFEKPEDLFGKKVGIIRGFSYLEYDKYFKEGKISSRKVDKQEQLIKMLKLKRLDCFIGNIHTTPYEIKLSGLPLEDFYFSNKALYSFQLMFQINKSKIKLKKDLDTFIRQAASNGLLKSIESKYR